MVIHQSCGLTVLAFCTLIARCSSALLLPISSVELSNEELCPDPIQAHQPLLIDIHNPRRPFYGYGMFPDVAMLKLVANDTCKFAFGDVRSDMYLLTGKAQLLSLHLRETLLVFNQKCLRVLSFPTGPGRDNETKCVTTMTPTPTPRLRNLSILGGLGQVKWVDQVMSFELPLLDSIQSSNQITYIVAVFKIITRTSHPMMNKCEYQIQQYRKLDYKPSGNCLEDMHWLNLDNTCGRMPCSKESDLTLERLQRGYPLTSKLMYEHTGRQDEGDGDYPEMNTLSYFLKGLTFPILMSISGYISYRRWRKKMKAAARLAEEIANASSSNAQQEEMGLHPDGVLIRFNEDHEKPPAYETLLDPPTYEQAIAPSNHLMELDNEELTSLLHMKKPSEDESDSVQPETIEVRVECHPEAEMQSRSLSESSLHSLDDHPLA